MSLGQVLAFLVMVTCFVLWLLSAMTLPIAFGCIFALALAMVLGGVKIGTWGGG